MAFVSQIFFNPSGLASRIVHPQLPQVLGSTGIEGRAQKDAGRSTDPHSVYGSTPWQPCLEPRGRPPCPQEHPPAAVLAVTRSPTASTGAPSIVNQAPTVSHSDLSCMGILLLWAFELM